jgi:hypothetical protein
LFQSVDPAGGFADSKSAVGADGCDARAVIAAVFQPPQTLQQEVHGLPRPDISDNPAHRMILGSLILRATIILPPQATTKGNLIARTAA